MSYTNASSDEPYLTPTEFADSVDWNLLAQLFGSGAEPLTKAQVIADPRVLRSLKEASGQIEAACFVGRRYDREALASLSGVSRAYMNRIVCNLAVIFCYGYRDGMAPPEGVLLRYEEATRELERLRLGESIFSFAEHAEAGLPSTSRIPDRDLDAWISATPPYRRFLGDRAERRRY